ncbi:antibiotic biosynthesis monooxygenase [Pseudomonas oryzihabitans]|nr:antibiotic biosynthesis monooxygenase [Pseudomonas psychrotolerans]
MKTFDLPLSYVVVAFTSQRADDDPEYVSMAQRMLTLAAEQPGFLGVESVRDAQGLGITLSYWTDRQAAADWGRQPEHREAQRLGRERWYLWYRTRVWDVVAGRDTVTLSEPLPAQE